jgi:hypothetical protein
MVVAKYERLTITEVDDLDDTVRGSEASDPPELKECCMYPLVDTHDGFDRRTSVIDDFVIHDRNVVLRANYGSGKNDSSPQIVNDVHASGGCALCLVYNASMKYEMRAKAELHSKHTIHHTVQLSSYSKAYVARTTTV